MARIQVSRSVGQSLDWKLIGLYLALVLFGLMNIYASIHGADGGRIFDWNLRSGKQAVWILTAFALALTILFILPSRLWEGAAFPLYVIVFFLLVLVIFVSRDVKGSHSWFSLGPVSFQPAEVSKITTSLMLALGISRFGLRVDKLSDFAKIAAIIGLPMLAILAESETGSAIVYIGFIFVLYREGLSGWWLALLGGSILIFVLTLSASAYVAAVVLLGIIMVICSLHGKQIALGFLLSSAVTVLAAFLPKILAAIPWEALSGARPIAVITIMAALVIPWLLFFAYRKKNMVLGLGAAAFITGMLMIFSTEFIFNDVLQPHQQKRIEVLLGLREDPAGVGYNVAQSMIAIGSGGFFGKGYLQGTQTTFGFVPEQTTDFIFCTVGEEWGFVGCLFVIALYVMLIWRIVKNAEQSREAFTRIYGYCVASMLFMHLLINVGMTVGLVPVIGIPLPLMSYGGSSLWAFTAMIFIFIVLDHEEKKYFG